MVITRILVPAVSNFVATAASGQMQFRGQGVAGLEYELKAALHLNSPIPWEPIATDQANKSGLIDLMDADMPQHPQRYSRIKSP